MKKGRFFFLILLIRGEMMRLLNDIVSDPELGGVPFTILRDHMILRQGEAALDFRETFPAFGAVQPAGDQDLALTPEEYRSETLMIFYSPIPFSLGARPDAEHFTAPDRIAYDGRSFLVVAVRDWMAFGFSRAIATQKKEAP